MTGKYYEKEMKALLTDDKLKTLVDALPDDVKKYKSFFKLADMAETENEEIQEKIGRINIMRGFAEAFKSADLDSDVGVMIFYEKIKEGRKGTQINKNASDKKEALKNFKGLEELIDVLKENLRSELKHYQNGLGESVDEDSMKKIHVDAMLAMYDSLVNWRNPQNIRNHFYPSMGVLNQAVNEIITIMHDGTGGKDLTPLVESIKEHNERMQKRKEEMEKRKLVEDLSADQIREMMTVFKYKSEPISKEQKDHQVTPTEEDIARELLEERLIKNKNKPSI